MDVPFFEAIFRLSGYLSLFQDLKVDMHALERKKNSTTVFHAKTYLPVGRREVAKGIQLF